MPRILKFFGKVGDQCNFSLDDGDTRVEDEGNIPHEFGINGGSDYVRISIDVDTGRIVGFDVEAAQKSFDDAIRAGKYDPNGEYYFDE